MRDGNERISGLDNQLASSIAHFMVCYTKDNLFVGSSRKIIHINVKDVLDMHNIEEFYGKEIGIEVPEDTIRKFDVERNYKFKGFIDIGSGNSSMIMENTESFTLSFVRISKVSEFGQDGITLISCGVDNSPNLIRSPVKDLRSIMNKD